VLEGIYYVPFTVVPVPTPAWPCLLPSAQNTA